MSTTKSKETLTRLAWITELRRQGERQCTGPGGFHKGGPVCAIVLLYEIAPSRRHPLCPRTAAIDAGSF